MAKILIADDALFMRSLIKNIVEESGHSVVAEASNGELAANLYIKNNPDVVIMDISMPDVNGIKGIEKILSFDSSARIIVCSVVGQNSMVLQAVKMGARDFVTKPFTSNRLLSAIETALIDKL